MRTSSFVSITTIALGLAACAVNATDDRDPAGATSADVTFLPMPSPAPPPPGPVPHGKYVDLGKGSIWVDPSAQLAGDFDGDGYSDVAEVAVIDGLLDFDVYLSSRGRLSPAQRWATNQGGYVDGMQFRAGDFNGDGRTDIATIFNFGNGQIDIDVHLSLGSAAAGGFVLQPWARNQGGWVASSDVLVGNFNNDRFADIAYVYDAYGITSPSHLIDVDVHFSNGSSFTGFSRWATNQGGWINLPLHDPDRFSHAYLSCTSCSRDGQWIAGDFNGDALTDLGLVWDDGGMIDLDVHLSTGGGFVGQRAATAQGGWVSECSWVAEDMNGDGRADMVNVFEDPGSQNADVDVHFSQIPRGALAVPNDGFTFQRWISQFPIAGSFWAAGPKPDGCGPIAYWPFTQTAGWQSGTILPMSLSAPTAWGLGDVLIVGNTDQYAGCETNKAGNPGYSLLRFQEIAYALY